MKYYAVKKGNVTGIFENWAECQNSVKGFPGAEFKSFSNKEEADAYLNGNDVWKDKIDEDLANGYLVAYTDGSFDEKLGRYSYGVLIIDKDKTETSLCGFGSNPKYLSSRNIIGEVLGVINAMDWAVSNGYEKVKLYHDYEGLPKWLSGAWAANSDVAKMFVAIFNEKFADVLSVEFVWVKGHSNNSFNEKADGLAKSAAKDRVRVAIQGDNWFSIPNYRKADLESLIDLIKEVDSNIIVNDENIGIRTFYRLKLNSDKLTITYFNSGNYKLLVQGQASLLFQIVVAILSEIDDVKFEKILSNAYRQTIDKDKIDVAYNAAAPVYPVNYPENIKKLIRQSIINLQYYIESEDYAQYAFPALRALEGHIKYLISTAGGTVGRNFNRFNKDPATLEYVFTGTLNDLTKKPQIEKCYNYYKSQRDTVFHFGNLLGTTDTTRPMATKAEADEIIKKCINLMCEV